MTDAPDLFADDPSPRPTGLQDGSAHVQETQVRLAQQVELAPRHAAHKAVDPQSPAAARSSAVIHSSGVSENDGPTPDGVGTAMQLSGHDIRVKEFRRTLLRGYSRADVDGFLTDVIKSFDACERTLMDAQPTKTRPAAKEASTEARGSADEIRAAAQTEADHILNTANSQAQSLRDETLQSARADAERGLMRARERARDVLQLVADREQQASRAEAETELRLAHIEQRLADKAKAVREQARHLDTLAAWLVEQDLRPEDPTVGGALPAHAAAPAPEPEGDVLAFKR